MWAEDLNPVAIRVLWLVLQFHPIIYTQRWQNYPTTLMKASPFIFPSFGFFTKSTPSFSNLPNSMSAKIIWFLAPGTSFINIWHSKPNVAKPSGITVATEQSLTCAVKWRNDLNLWYSNPSSLSVPQLWVNSKVAGWEKVHLGNLLLIMFSALSTDRLRTCFFQSHPGGLRRAVQTRGSRGRTAFHIHLLDNSFKHMGGGIEEFTTDGETFQETHFREVKLLEELHAKHASVERQRNPGVLETSSKASKLR